jgi:ribosome biogenesis SPOUT family RNA methylase Rps3
LIIFGALKILLGFFWLSTPATQKPPAGFSSFLHPKNMKNIYIIEHLEPKLWEWCILEYEHISETVGKDNLWFTNIKDKEEAKILEKFGRVFEKSVSQLNLNGICVLDPESDKLLEPADKDNFEYFVFGGILGDYPPRKRTKDELTIHLPNCETRHIGKEQMSTDNAVFTVKQILDGKKFGELKFEDNVTIEVNEFESIDLPYRYNLVDNKLFISDKLLKRLKSGEELS